jgi:hypothetical protein
MSLEPGALIVILMYALSLVVILYVSPRLDGKAETPNPWWRNTRFWASFVAIMQMIVYALWS